MILLTGEYQDLQDIREETGMDVMPWIQSAEDFELAKQMETRMTNQRQTRSYSRLAKGYGMMGCRDCGCW
jgi:hypothetical protein